MMTVKQLRTKTRFLVFFFISLVLPSLFLGYLSILGIQSDQAAAEQELLDGHRAAAQTIIDLVENELKRIELLISQDLEHPPRATESELRPLAEQLKRSSPLVSEPFVITRSRVLFPVATRLYYAGVGVRAYFPSQPAAASLEALTHATQLEFQAHDFENARAAYAQALEAAFSRSSRAEILFDLARTLRRLHKDQQARAIYREIIQTYADLRVAGGIPAELAAQMELVNLPSSARETSGTGQSILTLQAELARGKWDLAKPQFDFALDRVRKSWSRLAALSAPFELNHQRDFEESEAAIGTRAEASRELLLFEGSVVPTILKAADVRRPKSRAPRRFKTLTDSCIFCSIALPSPVRGPDAIEMLGVLLDAERESPALSAFLEQVILPSHTLFRVTNELGRPIAGPPIPASARKTIEAKFPSEIPSWTITFYYRDPEFFAQLLTSRRRVYVIGLILALGIVTFGSILTLRMISREVELATMQSDFVSTVSHELRSPLTSIRQLSEMLQRGRIPSEERRQRYYDTIVEQSERLSLLVENILDFARFEEGRKVFHFEEVDLNVFLREVVARVQQQVRHEGFAIRAQLADESLPARIDRDAMAQAIVNLLDNAMKFSPDSKEVSVSGCREADCARIDVKDYGIGIRPDEIKRVFDRFYRGSTEQVLSTRGTGLGLTIVKRIVEGHQGTITVQSAPGRGSTFTIMLPIEGANDHEDTPNSHHRG
jgi:signal transduction histidine kinase/tetratricopeptide (TPR) repeat protein